MRDGRATTGCQAGGRAAFKDVTYLLALFQYRALVAITRAGEALAAFKAQGVSADDVWNRASPLLYRAAGSHVRYFVFEKFVASLRQCEDVGCRQALERLAVIYALTDVQNGSQWLGLLQYEEGVWAEELLAEASAELRPDVVAMTDAFDFPDRILNSALGGKDGKVYEALLDAARRSALNVDAKGIRLEVPTMMKPLERRLDRSVLAWRNGLPPAARL